MLGAVRGLHWSQTVPDMVRVERESMPFFYAGNVSAAAALFESYPVNTDNQPIIEYQTPKLFRQVATRDQVIWCVGPKLANWIDRILQASPLEQDPSWRDHPPTSRHLVQSGVAFHRAMIYQATGKTGALEAAWADFIREWQFGAR